MPFSFHQNMQYSIQSIKSSFLIYSDAFDDGYKLQVTRLSLNRQLVCTPLKGDVCTEKAIHTHTEYDMYVARA